MRTTDLKELREIVDTIRRERHPELDAGFLDAVIRAEEDNPDDDAEALRAIQVALKTILSAKGAR